MGRMVGTVSRGLRAPIIRSGDDLSEIVCGSVMQAVENGAQGNYAAVSDIAADVREKLGGETIGVIFPILSRNRFAICLRGIAGGAKKVVLMLSYPSDEVGNHLVDIDALDERGTRTRTFSRLKNTESFSDIPCTPSPAWTMCSITPTS